MEKKSGPSKVFVKKKAKEKGNQQQRQTNLKLNNEQRQIKYTQNTAKQTKSDQGNCTHHLPWSPPPNFLPPPPPTLHPTLSPTPPVLFVSPSLSLPLSLSLAPSWRSSLLPFSPCVNVSQNMPHAIASPHSRPRRLCTLSALCSFANDQADGRECCHREPLVFTKASGIPLQIPVMPVAKAPTAICRLAAFHLPPTRPPTHPLLACSFAGLRVGSHTLRPNVRTLFFVFLRRGGGVVFCTLSSSASELFVSEELPESKATVLPPPPPTLLLPAPLAIALHLLVTRAKQVLESVASSYGYSLFVCRPNLTCPPFFSLPRLLLSIAAFPFSMIPPPPPHVSVGKNNQALASE